MAENSTKKTENKSPKTFRLSSKGMLNAYAVNAKADFVFLVGEKEPYTKYEVPSFFANFISPKVALKHATDSALSEFHIPISDENGNFSLIIDLSLGRSIHATDIQKIFIREVAKILGNDELYQKFVSSSQITLTNAILQLTEKITNGMDPIDQIDFIAAHFEDYQVNELLNIPVFFLEKIFTSPQLLVKKENSFFNTVYQIVENKSSDPEYLSLFSTIFFQNLKKDSLEKFCSFVKSQDITTSLWNALLKRLTSIENIVSEKDPRYFRKVTTCNKDPDMFHGIFFMLSQKCSGNPVLKELVDVTSFGMTGSCKPQGLFYCEAKENKDNKFSFALTEKVNNYLMMDFKDCKVSINGYSIQSASNSHWDLPQSWVIEGSNDGLKWTVFEEKVENLEMVGSDKSQHWSCPLSDEFRMIRWRLTKDGSGALYSRRFELFGQYIEYQKMTNDDDSVEEEEWSDDDEFLTFPFTTSK